MKIGLAAWIIQDGNYPDFAVGDVRSLALEFYAPSISLCRGGVTKFEHHKNCLYEITARIVFKQDDFVVIDFGRRAYSERKMEANVGDWVTGQIYLGIDPFMYFESWEREPNVPKLGYRWRIDRIFLENTPLIETKARFFERDESRFGEVEIAKTNAWKDDKGTAAYALECTEAGETRRCPCCGFSTLHRHGADEICAVCYWHDDGQSDHDADLVRGGPNYELSLTQARKNFGALGAVDRKHLNAVRAPTAEEK